MSHFTTIKTQIKNGQILLQTLQQLGHTVETDTTVRGYRGISTNANYVIRRRNGYDIGFVKKGEVYEAIADFWGVDLNQQQFMQKVTQTYAQNVVLDYAQNHGYDVESTETLEDGTVRVVVGGWV